MQALDSLVWAGGLSFVSYGVRVGIRADDANTLPLLRELLPPDARPSRSPFVDHLFSLRTPDAPVPRLVGKLNVLYQGSDTLAGLPAIEDALEQLESTLHSTVATNAPEHVFVHAGAVGWHDTAILIPGHSMSGKTELVRSLVRAGAAYYSDEYAVLDARARLHPYTKRLSLRTGDCRSHQPVENLGGHRGSRPLPVGLVVLTEHEPGAEWKPQVLTPAQAMLGLLEHTVATQVRPELSLATLKRLVLRATVVRSKRDEAAAAAGRLLAACDEFAAQNHHIDAALASERSR